WPRTEPIRRPRITTSSALTLPSIWEVSPRTGDRHRTSPCTRPSTTKLPVDVVSPAMVRSCPIVDAVWVEPLSAGKFWDIYDFRSVTIGCDLMAESWPSQGADCSPVVLTTPRYSGRSGSLGLRCSREAFDSLIRSSGHFDVLMQVHHPLFLSAGRKPPQAHP